MCLCENVSMRPNITGPDDFFVRVIILPFVIKCYICMCIYIYIHLMYSSTYTYTFISYIYLIIRPAIIRERKRERDNEYTEAETRCDIWYEGVLCTCALHISSYIIRAQCTKHPHIIMYIYIYIHLIYSSHHKACDTCTLYTIRAPCTTYHHALFCTLFLPPYSHIHVSLDPPPPHSTIMGPGGSS